MHTIVKRWEQSDDGNMYMAGVGVAAVRRGQPCNWIAYAYSFIDHANAFPEFGCLLGSIRGDAYIPWDWDVDWSLASLNTSYVDAMARFCSPGPIVLQHGICSSL